MRGATGITVWAVEPGGTRRGILTAVSVSIVKRESEVSTFSLTLNAAGGLAQQITDGWRIILVDTGRVELSGPVQTIEHETKGSASTLTVTGVSDMTALADRIVYPDPALAADKQTTVSHYKDSGPAEAVIARLVNRQAGPAALPVRRTRNLATFPEGTRGAAVTLESRFQSLADEVKSLARAGGLVVDMVQDTDGREIVPRVRVPRDLSRSVRFMPRTGLGDYTTKVKPAEVSTVVVGGGGQGTARLVIERSAAGASRRVERFQDRRDTTEPAEIEKAATETLEENAATASASFDVMETEGHRFGTHFDLGDTVTVEPAHGVQIVDKLRAVEITWTPTGREVKLTVGEHTTDTERTPAWVREVRHLQKQLRRIGGGQ